jgi:Tol biopolymer transport system component
MTSSSNLSSDPSGTVPGDRLESWKEIAAYMRRDVKTVQRWERREGMPVHRHLHDKLGSVYAFRSELDVWARNRRPIVESDSTVVTPVESKRPIWPWGVGAIAIAIAIGAAFAILQRGAGDTDNPLANARFQQLEFDGSEQAAAISRDGKLIAFLSNRDGRTDVILQEIGSAEFHNLTRGGAGELVNPSVRTIDFSPDGTLVTFWTRRLDASQQSEISVWAIPVLGGAPRLYLDGVAEYRWSSDAARLVYHTPGPGDPTFVRDATDSSAGRQVFSAPSGLHAHFPIWSPDGAFIYFVQGAVPDRMDIWRLTASGGAPERITRHDSAVSYPVFLDARRLLYLATDRDGSGPWIYSLDVNRRTPVRASFGIDRYTSLAASSDARRLVATVATPKSTLWRVQLGAAGARATEATLIALTTANGSAPRLGDGSLVYVSSAGTSDSIWRVSGDRATQVWTEADTRVVGGPALDREGRRIAFSTRRRDGRTFLWIANADGTGARTLSAPPDVQGSPAWAPDGRSIAIGALVDDVPRLFSVSVDGGAPLPLLQENSSDPVWSADGGFVVFSGADVGTTFTLKAADATGRSRTIPALTLTRGARRVVFIDGGRSLVFLRGDMRHKNLWSVDLETGAERQLTEFAPGFDVKDFDVTPDGREIVVEQVQEHSNVVLLDLPRSR